MLRTLGLPYRGTGRGRYGDRPVNRSDKTGLDAEPDATVTARRGSVRQPTWHARGGRLTPTKRWALRALGERFAIGLDAVSLAPFSAVAIEIGAGTGEAALTLARARPETLVIATEVHQASLARLLADAHRSALANVAVLAGDGRDVLGRLALVRRVDLVRIFFPDPWPKRRHLHRRLVCESFLGDLAAGLAVGGVAELATDHAEYARAIRRLFDGDDRFECVGTDRAERPLTYYERRATHEGRSVFDVRVVHHGRAVRRSPR